MRPSREEVERVGLGTAPRRLLDSARRAKNGCLLWIGPFKTSVPQIRMSAGGYQWIESATVLAFRIARGRWPVGAVVRSCRNAACIEDAHFVELPMCETGKFADVPTRSLTVAQVKEARDRYVKTGSIRGMAPRMGVRYALLWNAATGKTYRSFR